MCFRVGQCGRLFSVRCSSWLEKGKIEFGVIAQNLLNAAWKEAQFETESRLRNEIEPVSEIHFAPGTPFFVKGYVRFKF